MIHKKVLLCVGLLTTCILCSCGNQNASVESDSGEIIAADADAPSEGTAKDSIYAGNGSAWKPTLFEYPATDYNNELALVAARMSEAAENESGNDETLRGLLSSYGLFQCEYSYFDGTDIWSAGGAFAVGQSILTINGADTTVLVITARGTKNVREGVGDFFKGGEKDFLGTKVWKNAYDFEEKIWNGIKDYIADYPDIASKENLKILITGHSLGGAAANMIGARFTDGVGSGEWWGGKVSKEDIYVYTFGAIKVLTTENNSSEGYGNIHNIYNHYDSFGPNGNIGSLGVSSINAKFGHIEEYRNYHPEESIESNGNGRSTNNHNMAAYIEDLEQNFVVNMPCKVCGNTDSCLLSEENVQESVFDPASPMDSFFIEGKWKNIGTNYFGQAQSGSIISFDGQHCNFYSPYDTYVFYKENEQWILDCSSYIFSETLRFHVDIVDGNRIDIYYGSDAIELERISQTADTIEKPVEENGFSIEGDWISVGSYGFGQAQPGAVVTFDGVHCNFYSPYDTYAFYQKDGGWKLECTNCLWADTVSFTVQIIDKNTIHVSYGTSVTELERMAE